jgi:hypothetical protein
MSAAAAIGLASGKVLDVVVGSFLSSSSTCGVDCPPSRCEIDDVDDELSVDAAAAAVAATTAAAMLVEVPAVREAALERRRRLLLLPAELLLLLLLLLLLPCDEEEEEEEVEEWAEAATKRHRSRARSTAALLAFLSCALAWPSLPLKACAKDATVRSTHTAHSKLGCSTASLSDELSSSRDGPPQGTRRTSTA